MARTVADAFNQYHQQYVKPQMNARLTSSAAAATYATQASLATRATLDSPHFTGTPTAPTAGNDTDSTQIATTEFCQNLIRRLCGVDTKTIALLADLADALLNQPDFRDAVVTVLDNKLDKSVAASTYLGKSDAAATYLGKSDAAATYMKKTDSIDTSNLAKLNTSNTFTGALYVNNSFYPGDIYIYNMHSIKNRISGAFMYGFKFDDAGAGDNGFYPSIFACNGWAGHQGIYLTYDGVNGNRSICVGYDNIWIKSPRIDLNGDVYVNGTKIG